MMKFSAIIFSNAFLTVTGATEKPLTSWTFNLTSSSGFKCADDSFPRDMNNKQCKGLASVLYADDSDACRSACCMDDSCKVWQFCPSGSTCSGTVGPACWAGTVDSLDDCEDGDGWVSEGRDQLPPKPEPSSECDVDVIPMCGTDYDDSDWRVVSVPHDFVVEGAFDQTADMSHGYLNDGMAWYRSHFVVEEDEKDDVYYLDFGGVMQVSAFVCCSSPPTHPPLPFNLP